MNSEAIIRLAFFGGIFVVIALWEILLPRRSYDIPRSRRWSNNIIVIILNTLLIRVIAPVMPLTLAVNMEKTGWGFFNYIDLPAPLEAILAFLLLDLIIYLQHLMFHAVPLLWRLHMVHHADLGIDVTTGLRFHPIEIVISLGIKMAAVFFLGAPAVSILIFEIALNGTAMFNHGNIYIHPRIDYFLRMLVVTPDMHRVHHSVAIGETNSNFGFNFPWWDRLLGTYRPRSYREQKNIVIGLSQYREHVSLLDMLLLPFLGNPGKYSIDRWARIPGEKEEEDK